MQEIRWKEPEFINEIEKQRALEERPQRMRLFFRHLLLRINFMILAIAVIFLLFSYFTGHWDFAWNQKDFRLPRLLILSNTVPDVFSAWQGTPNGADSCRVSKLGVTRINAMQNFAWRDIEDYRFEACDDAPNLRVLIVEARGRKAPLRLYYEGEQLEARLRDVMQQGLASTRKLIPRGTIPT